MNKPRKYNYYRVIQGNYGYGWEDVSQYETNSQYITAHYNKDVKHDLIEYIASGIGSYRVIKRRELNTTNCEAI